LNRVWRLSRVTSKTFLKCFTKRRRLQEAEIEVCSLLWCVSRLAHFEPSDCA
jgi:hypothetical protein